MEFRFVCIVFNHLVIVRTEANRRVEWITSDGDAFHFPVLTICWLVSHLYLCWIDGWWSVSITQLESSTLVVVKTFLLHHIHSPFSNWGWNSWGFDAHGSIGILSIQAGLGMDLFEWLQRKLRNVSIRAAFVWSAIFNGSCLLSTIEGVDELKIALCLRNPPWDECPCLQLPAGHGVYWWQCLSVGLRLNVLAFVGGTGNGKEESIFSLWCSCNLNNDPRIVEFSIAVTYFIDEFSNRWEIPLGK